MSRLAYRLAIATGAATFVLILAGGLVTNTGAGLAVPDWPTTFGYNMFLYPWARMVGGIFYEHSHRLIGAVVGCLTLALGAALWPLGGLPRKLGIVAIAAVIVQGLLGGLRVVLLADTLAIVHGCIAQAFFALVVAIAVLVSPRSASMPVDPALRPLVLAVTALVYVQIVFGALLTHAGRLDLHLAGAVIVYVFVPIVTARLRRTGVRAIARPARALVALLAVQLALGIGSYLARFSPIWIPGGSDATVVLPVVHRLTASLILATAVVLAVRTRPGAVERASAAPLATAAGVTS